MAGNYSTEIRSTTETAFQRAIILGGTSIIDGEIVEWLDIELPVDGSRKAARGHCVDLIGKSKDGYVICELKFGKNAATDSPEEASNQLKMYRANIERYWSVLDGEKIYHKNGKPFLWKEIADNARYIIAANEEYWSYWLTHKEEVQLPSDFECYSLNVKNDCFKQQKANNTKYKPELPECEWTRIK